MPTFISLHKEYSQSGNQKPVANSAILAIGRISRKLSSDTCGRHIFLPNRADCEFPGATL